MVKKNKPANGIHPSYKTNKRHMMGWSDKWDGYHTSMMATIQLSYQRMSRVHFTAIFVIGI